MEQHELKLDDPAIQDHIAGIKACFGGDHALWKKWLPVDGIELLGAQAVLPILAPLYSEVS